MAARSGKMPTTSVRRRTSRFSRSWGLLLQIWRQCSRGKVAKASTSEPASASSDAASEKRSCSCSTIRACWAQTASRSGWAKIERTSVAANVCADRVGDTSQKGGELLIRGHLDQGDSGAGRRSVGPLHVEVDLTVPTGAQGAAAGCAQVVDVEFR